MGDLDALKGVYKINLGVKKHERVLVFTDRPSPEEALSQEDALRRERLGCIALMAAEIGRALTREVLFLQYPSAGGHGIEPPEALWRIAFGEAAVKALKDKRLLGPILNKKITPDSIKEAEKIIIGQKNRAVDAVVALSHYSTTHTTFRNLLTTHAGARYASMPLFDASMLEGPMRVDYRGLAKRTEKTAAKLNKAVFIEIKAPNGTDMAFSSTGRKAKADTGILKKPGICGNLPAGEAFLAPLEGTSNGRLVLEWAPTRRLKSPVVLTVKDGLVTGVAGKDPFSSVLRQKLSERRENGNIAELGIGTNDMAKRPDNILESEKILGTVHIALGDNSGFGGCVKTPFHQDFVFFGPTVTLTDDKGKKTVLLKNGKLVI